MHKKISVKLTSRSINEALAEVNELIRGREKLSDKRLRQIADRIRDKAQANFESAWYDEIGRGVRREAHIECTVEKTANGYKVIAHGDEVTFIEFGAGVYFNPPAGASPHPKGAELGFVIGEYGKSHGKQKSWGYYENDGASRHVVITHGTAAQMPLYNAFIEVCEELRK